MSVAEAHIQWMDQWIHTVTLYIPLTRQYIKAASGSLLKCKYKDKYKY